MDFPNVAEDAQQWMLFARRLKYFECGLVDVHGDGWMAVHNLGAGK